MSNIKIGDIVVQQGVFNCTPKMLQVLDIKAKTISLGRVAILDGKDFIYSQEPKQHPEAWRVYDRETVAKIKELSKSIGEIRQQISQLYESMPKVMLD